VPGVAETAFDEAFAALREERYAAAADAFQRAALAGAGQPIEEDAAFFRAVAWARAGRKGDAARDLRDFLGRHSRSVRAGEASAMLGWLLIDDSGALDEAERRFRAAERDRKTEVAESARAGLFAVAQRRKQKNAPAPRE
jgi:TolA-binding protein